MLFCGRRFSFGCLAQRWQLPRQRRRRRWRLARCGLVRQHVLLHRWQAAAGIGNCRALCASTGNAFALIAAPSFWPFFLFCLFYLLYARLLCLSFWRICAAVWYSSCLITWFDPSHGRRALTSVQGLHLTVICT